MSQIDTTTSLGYWIRRQRMALDLTQAELARQVGCAAVTVSKIERDERRPSRQMAKLIATRLAIPEAEQDRFLSIAMGDASVDRMPLTNQPDMVHDALITPTTFSTQSNLPTPTTPFIGRSDELHQLIDDLENPNCRLLSLVGPGGFGKTRLAIQVGALLHNRDELFADGVFFVALEGVENTELVVPTIATALKFAFIEQHDQDSLLLNYLANKEMMLILDNGEQILEAELVDKILAHSARVKLLVTSREALQLQQEWFVPIAGMMGKERSDTADAASAKSDAVQLFDACARRARPNFDLPIELEHVLQICQQADGVPLAIELAAAWLRTLSCAQIADELNRSIDILSSTHRNLPERHRTMRNVLAQSWAFLSEDEQRVFRRLSVFVGSFSLEAAQQVTDTSLPILAALVEKSIVQLAQDGRYRIHALLRQFGSEKLAEAPDELASVQSLHSDFYIAFLKERNESIAGREQKVVLEEVETEFGNVRVAWSYAAKQGQSKQLDDALLCLFRYLWTRGKFEDGERMMVEALGGREALSSKRDDVLIRIRITARKARFMAAMGDYEAALEIVEKAQQSAEQLGGLSEQALCLSVAGLVNHYKKNGMVQILTNQVYNCRLVMA